MTSTIPYTIPLNNPKTIQFSSSLVNSSLVSYAVLLILHGLKSFLYFSGWLSMSLEIFGLMLNMFGSVINTYFSDLKPIHHSDFYTHLFSPVAHTFPTPTLYPHGDTEPLVFSVPYDNISDISDSFQPYIRSRKVLYHIGRMACDSHHNFVVIQRIVCVTLCLNFCTIWEGVCTYLFSSSDFVCRS